MKRINTILSSAITLALVSSPLYAQEIELNSVTMDTVSGDQLGGFNHQGGLDQLFESQKEMVFHILEQIGVSEESLPPGVRNEIAKKQTSSFPAFVAFSEGLNQQDKGDFKAAEASFTRAAQLDPNFEMAAQALEALPEAEASVAQVAEKSQKEAEEEAEEEVAEEEQEADEEVATVESEDEQLIAEAESGDGDGATSISSEPVFAEVVSDSGSEVAQQQATEDALQGGYFDKSVASFQGGIYATYLLKSTNSGSTYKEVGYGFQSLENLTAVAGLGEASEIFIEQTSAGGKIDSEVDSNHHLIGGAGFHDTSSGSDIYGGTGDFTRATPITSVSYQSPSSGSQYYSLGYYTSDDIHWTPSGSDGSVQYQMADNKLWYAEGPTTSGSALDTLAQANARYTYSGYVAGVSFIAQHDGSPATVDSCISGTCGSFSATLDFGTHKVNDLSLTARTTHYNVAITADNVDIATDGTFGFGSGASGVSMSVGWNGSGGSPDSNYTATSGGLKGAPGGEGAGVVGGTFRTRYGASDHSLTASGNFGGSR